MSAPVPLDSPAWATIHGPYGSCERVPAILRELARDPERALRELSPTERREDDLDDLLQQCFHQGDLTVATFAIAPHLVAISRSLSERHPFSLLRGLIAARSNDG